MQKDANPFPEYTSLRTPENTKELQKFDFYYYAHAPISSINQKMKL